MNNKQIKVMLVSRESTDNNSIWLKQFSNNEPKSITVVYNKSK